MNLSLTVYMDRRDVTEYVSSLSITQNASTYYREFELTLKGWQFASPTASWDIYGTRNPAEPRQALLIRNGTVPPDRQGTVTIDGTVPSLTLTGYDWAWMAQRRQPKTTVILAPTAQEARKEAMKEEKYDKAQLGRWTWVPAMTMHQAVQALAALAGFFVEMRMPDYSLTVFVVDPGKSYWDAIIELLAPYVPRIYFRRTENRVLIADCAVQWLGIGSKLLLGEANVKSITAASTRFKYVRRVLLRRV